MNMRLWLAVLLDVVAVLVFVGIGRSVHTDGVTAAGMASTSWPFLAGAAAGWLIGRAWRRPTGFIPAAVCIWLGCVALGMALRVVSGQGTAVAFIAVALGFLGAEMFGWRLVLRGIGSLRVPDRTDPQGSPLSAVER